MKSTKQITEITIEKERVLLVRRRQTSAIEWCARCSDRVAMLPLDQAASVAGVSSRTIYRLVENGQLHFQDTPEGMLLVCLDSLFAVLNEKSVNEKNRKLRRK